MDIRIVTEQPIRYGLVEMTNDAYHAAQGESKSRLDTVDKAPAFYWDQYEAPDREPRVETPAMVAGSAIHSAILEPDLFVSEHAVAPDVDRRTKGGKEEYSDFLRTVGSRTILTATQYEIAIASRDAVYKHPVASKLMRGGMSEQTYFAIDEDTGALIKCRVDYLLRHSAMVIDVKSTEDASDDAFERSIVNYRYYVQDPWYRHVIESAGEEPIKTWLFMAIEKTRPFAINFFHLDDDARAHGMRTARRNLGTILRCRESGNWPDYSTMERMSKSVTLKPWVK